MAATAVGSARAPVRKRFAAILEVCLGDALGLVGKRMQMCPLCRDSCRILGDRSNAETAPTDASTEVPAALTVRERDQRHAAARHAALARSAIGPYDPRIIGPRLKFLS